MRRRIFAGADHPHLATSLNNMGMSLKDAGDRAAGLALQREALDMRRRIFAGADHPHLATSLSNFTERHFEAAAWRHVESFISHRVASFVPVVVHHVWCRISLSLVPAQQAAVCVSLVSSGFLTVRKLLSLACPHVVVNAAVT